MSKINKRKNNLTLKEAIELFKKGEPIGGDGEFPIRLKGRVVEVFSFLTFNWEFDIEFPESDEETMKRVIEGEVESYYDICSPLYVFNEELIREKYPEMFRGE